MHNNKQNFSEKHLVFIGFMGVGKTTIGELVAQKLKREFIDTDQLIEAHFGLTIPQIFERFGEEYFRRNEKEMIESIVLENQPKVISLGGGAFLQQEVRDICLERCLVLFLNLDWDVWTQRLDELKGDRPLLKGKNIEQIKALFEQRYPIYAMSHTTIDIKEHTPEQITEMIMTSFKSLLNE